MDFISFIIARYNYWIFILLMMIGLYTVIARGNLIKKLIGLNVFQTSVFIYYISIGKITGGTAPIYTPADMAAREAGGHGAAVLPGKDALGEGALHAGAPDFASAGNSLEQLTKTAKAPPDAAPPLHSAPGGGVNDMLASPALTVDSHAATAVKAAHDAAHVIYSNPLPHVLILTAIVVGVATTAVGLAIVVRIREAYGSIEEDELEAADTAAEFGTRADEGTA